jgi:hypothetical protein
LGDLLVGKLHGAVARKDRFKERFRAGWRLRRQRRAVIEVGGAVEVEAFGAVGMGMLRMLGM